MTVTTVDYAHTSTAAEGRAVKARTLAAWLWDHDLRPADVHAMPEPRRRAAARDAGVVPPSSWETWQAALDQLGLRTAWAATDPGHPAVLRAHADQRGQWLTNPDTGAYRPCAGCDEVNDSCRAVGCAADGHAPRGPAPQLERGPDAPTPPTELEQTVAPSLRPVAPNLGAPPAVVIPKGWAALALLGPIRDRIDSRCHVCRGPAVVGTLNVWRCGEHPPQPGEWGALMDWTPRVRWCAPHRCTCGRCAQYRLAPVATASDLKPAARSSRKARR